VTFSSTPPVSQCHLVFRRVLLAPIWLVDDFPIAVHLLPSRRVQWSRGHRFLPWVSSPLRKPLPPLEIFSFPDPSLGASSLFSLHSLAPLMVGTVTYRLTFLFSHSHPTALVKSKFPSSYLLRTPSSPGLFQFPSFCKCSLHFSPNEIRSPPPLRSPAPPHLDL